MFCQSSIHKCLFALPKILRSVTPPQEHRNPALSSPGVSASAPASPFTWYWRGNLPATGHAIGSFRTSPFTRSTSIWVRFATRPRSLPSGHRQPPAVAFSLPSLRSRGIGFVPRVALRAPMGRWPACTQPARDRNRQQNSQEAARPARTRKGSGRRGVSVDCSGVPQAEARDTTCGHLGVTLQWTGSVTVHRDGIRP